VQVCGAAGFVDGAPGAASWYVGLLHAHLLLLLLLHVLQTLLVPVSSCEATSSSSSSSSSSRSSSPPSPGCSGPGLLISSVPFAEGSSLACLHLLQVLPLCGSSSSSRRRRRRRQQLVEVLLSGVSRMLHLLPVDDLYGLLQVRAAWV